MPPPRTLVLASTSPYRRELLARLGLPFEWCDPDADESPRGGESAAQTAERLAVAKATGVASRFPKSLIIGADQVAFCGLERLDKPLSHEAARRQLELVSGKLATFETAVALCDAQTGHVRARVVSTQVQFRPLGAALIEAYLLREKPYDCAGSAKVEGLGIALLARVESDDPTALIGLPLIALTEMLAAAGQPVLAS